MKIVYIAVYEAIDIYGDKKTRTLATEDEERILELVASFVDDDCKLNRVFSVDEYGTKITHYDVIFDGRLKLVEKEHSY